MTDYSIYELRKIDEAYRSVYDNPNVRLENDPTGFKRKLAENIYEVQKTGEFPQIANYTEMMFRWLKTDLSSDNTDMALISRVYVLNFENLIDYLIEYEHNVKRLKENGVNPSECGIDIDRGNGKYSFIPYDALSETRNRINGIGLIEYVGRVLSRMNIKIIRNFDETDKSNVAFTNRGNGAIVFTTKTFDSTNKFIYHLWQNTNFNSSYGRPNENSPYCTRNETLWEQYSRNNPNYKQFWFLADDGTAGNCPFGDLNDDEVAKMFERLKGKGGKLLICMNDSLGDILDRYDERPQIDLDGEFASYISGVSRELATSLREYGELKTEVEDYVKMVETNRRNMMNSLEEFKGIVSNHRGNTYQLVAELDGMMGDGMRISMSTVPFPEENDEEDSRGYLDSLCKNMASVVSIPSSSLNHKTMVWNSLDMMKRIANRLGFQQLYVEIERNVENFKNSILAKNRLIDEYEAARNVVNSLLRRESYDVSASLTDSPKLLQLYRFRK